MKKHTAPPAARNIADLYRERDIAKLQHKIVLLKSNSPRKLQRVGGARHASPST